MTEDPIKLFRAQNQFKQNPNEIHFQLEASKANPIFNIPSTTITVILENDS
jgi:hypothetical protein